MNFLKGPREINIRFTLSLICSTVFFFFHGYLKKFTRGFNETGGTVRCFLHTCRLGSAQINTACFSPPCFLDVSGDQPPTDTELWKSGHAADFLKWTSCSKLDLLPLGMRLYNFSSKFSNLTYNVTSLKECFFLNPPNSPVKKNPYLFITGKRILTPSQKS